MEKFLVLYRSSVPAEEAMSGGSSEEAEAGMELWMAWAGKASGSIIDMGSPVGKAHVVPAGSASSAGLSVGGFSILEADSLEALMPLMDDHPHLHAPDASIEILEYLPLPGT